ncbi:hypothetical protein [Nevskia ramosa]|uniref:hypothetical protein n=1 Tax=Nevskia ramosa TaxID=64002 RepID=UPI002354D20A|nr:hypothetical protein [Nevskia ramosa]
MTDLALLAYALIVKLHIAAGVIALIAFWTAGFARKGRGGLHVSAGSIYLMAMRAILITGLPMALSSFIKGHPGQGVFLSYLVVLVATTVFVAPRAVRFKQDFDGFRSGAYRFYAVLLPATALAAMSYGLVAGNALLIGFPVVGLVIGTGMWRNMRRASPDAGWWLKEHYGAMIGNGVGTHIAFLAIGLSRLLPKAQAETAQLLAWFGPLTIATIAIVLLNRRHRRRHSQPLLVH